MMDADFNKVARAAFFDELEILFKQGGLPVDFLEKAAEIDFEQMAKEAISFGGIGQGLKTGLQGMGQGMQKAIAPARAAINTAAAKVSPTLAQPMSQVAHGMQHSPNAFMQGVGNVLHHKTQSTGKGLLAMANPVGSAAEMAMGGVGTAASKGLAAAGGKLQQATGAADAVAQQGRAMTPKGQLLNAASSFGNRMQQAFSPGGTGHNVLTKHLPMAAEIGGAAGAGMALHAPVGLAGAIGKAGLGALGKAAPAAASLAEHGLHHVGSAADILHHGAVDAIGTFKQNRLAGGLGRAFAPSPMGV